MPKQYILLEFDGSSKLFVTIIHLYMKKGIFMSFGASNTGKV